MSIRELIQAALEPYRWARLASQQLNSDAPTLSKTPYTSVILPAVRYTQDINVPMIRVELVPGGRYLIAHTGRRLAIYDLANTTRGSAEVVDYIVTKQERPDSHFFTFAFRDTKLSVLLYSIGSLPGDRWFVSHRRRSCRIPHSFAIGIMSTK